MLNIHDFSSAFPRTNLLPPEDESEQAEKLTTIEKFNSSKMRILVFSPDSEVRFLFKTILEIWNYEAVEADSVEQSVRLAENGRPALVLMDTELAFSESFSKMRTMRKSEWFKEIPFILISGHAREDIRLMALAAGADEFLVKPVNLEVLEITLKSRLNNDNLPATDH